MDLMAWAWSMRGSTASFMLWKWNGGAFRCLLPLRLNAETEDFVCPNGDSTPPRKKREAQIGLINYLKKKN